METKIKIIDIESEEYPQKLRELEKNAPKQLYCAGDISLLKQRAVAVVGARKASSYGKWAAYNVGKKLARNKIVTVSGMADGCDSEAHTGALEYKGKTIAVLGCGVDVCYPRKNIELRNRILEEGLIISEYPPGTAPLKYHFPLRNRIISGLSDEVIVVEAGISSGSLITAECAANQGRTVLAFPGNVSNIMSMGCNKLIQDGAFPIVGLDDVISQLSLDDVDITEDKPARFEIGTDEKKLYELVKIEGETTADFIAAKLNKSISHVNALVTIMEIKGILLSSSGKIYIAK